MPDVSLGKMMTHFSYFDIGVAKLSFGPGLIL